MPVFSALKPVLFCFVNLLFVFQLSDLRDVELRFLLPLLICLLSLLFIRSFVLLILLPNKVFLFFIPNSLFLFLVRVLVSYIQIEFCILDSWKVIKLCFLGWVFRCWNVVNWIFEILLCWFLLSLCDLYFHSFNLLNWDSLFIFLLFVIFQLLHFIFVQHLFPVHAIF